MPINGGEVSVKIKDGILRVSSDKDGGVLVYNNEEYKINGVIEVKII